MSKNLQKVMKNRGNKIAVKKTVMRGGRAFQQTFWVRPEDIKKEREKKVTPKDLMKNVAAKATVEHHQKLTDAVLQEDVNGSRDALEKLFIQSGMAPHKHKNERTTKIVDNLPMGINGTHDQNNGNIELPPNVVAGAKHFLEEYAKLDQAQWAKDVEEWSKAEREYVKFQTSNKQMVVGEDGKKRPKWQELERKARAIAEDSPLDRPPPFKVGEADLQEPEFKVETTKSSAVVGKPKDMTSVEAALGKHMLSGWEREKRIEIDYLDLVPDNPGDPVPGDVPMSMYKKLADYAIEQGKPLLPAPYRKVDDYEMDFWRGLKSLGYDVRMHPNAVWGDDRWEVPRADPNDLPQAPVFVLPVKPTEESKRAARVAASMVGKVKRAREKLKNPEFRKKHGLPASPRPTYQHPVRQMLAKAESYLPIPHEVLHGFGPCNPGQYAKEGVVVEEITTEILARKHIREKFKFSVTAVAAGDFGAYNDYIAPFREQLQHNYKLTPGEAQLMMEKAALAYKQKQRAEGSTAHRALIADFVKEFKEPTGDPAWDEERSGGWTELHLKLREKIEDVTPRVFI